MDKFTEILKGLPKESCPNQSDLPPVDNWNPPLSGVMDLVIKSNGDWFHEGSEFQRKSIVHLLSKVLKREEDQYFLVTPVEKWKIEVEDAPFYVHSMELLESDGVLMLSFETATGDKVIAGRNNPIRVETDVVTKEPSPYILVRSNLEARISRKVFYELVNIALNQSNQDDTELHISSLDESFSLGSVE